MQGEAAVVGVGESIYYRAGRSPHDAFQLACIAIRNAIADAGPRKRLAHCPRMLHYLIAPRGHGLKEDVHA